MKLKQLNDAVIKFPKSGGSTGKNNMSEYTSILRDLTALIGRISTLEDKSKDNMVMHKALKFAGDTANKARIKLKDTHISESSHTDKEGVRFVRRLKDGVSEFQIRDRDTSGMKGKQDKFEMVIVNKKTGKVTKDFGTHPDLGGAMKFFQNKLEKKLK